MAARRVMPSDYSVRFFNEQFKRQIGAGELALNPFEQAALPYLRGCVLDYGCGLGNLACAAAQRGCSVLALDASAAAIDHLKNRVAAEGLAVEARQADLRDYEISEDFDVVVSIGLLMFFDCDRARRTLSRLQAAVRAGGLAVINVLVEGTTYLEMFDAQGHCLFERDEIEKSFAGWQVQHLEFRDFPAPGERVKSFVTLIARKP
jgi:tellurite methyltransferase